MSTTEFHGYAEGVFRRQNRAESNLMLLLPDLKRSDSTGYGRISRAETEMLEACSSLNRMAVLYEQGKPASFRELLRMPEDVVVCEQRTEEVEKVLDEYGYPPDPIEPPVPPPEPGPGG